MSTEAVLIQQHLIDPEICIRCNTCESVCPVGAITHDSRNWYRAAADLGWRIWRFTTKCITQEAVAMTAKSFRLSMKEKK